MYFTIKDYRKNHISAIILWRMARPTVETGEGLTGIKILPRCPCVLRGVVLGQILGPSTAPGEACRVVKVYAKLC